MRFASKIVHRTVTLVIVAVICALAWVSGGLPQFLDVTASGRHSLSPPTIDLLKQLDGPIVLTLFVDDQPQLRYQVERFADRYRRHYPEFQVRFIDPAQDPTVAQEYGVSGTGEVFIEFAGRRQSVLGISESKLTAALFKLQRAADRWVLFLTGHGERSPFGKANHDVGAWGEALRERGWPVQLLNLSHFPTVPDNTAVLVVASVQVDLLPGEAQIISDFVERGGNLVWLREPDGNRGLDGVARQLGLAPAQGTIVDPTTQRLGVDNPSFALAADYAPHAALMDFQLLSVYPYATTAHAAPEPPWQATKLIVSARASWLEMSPLDGSATFDESIDRQGPIPIATALTREVLAINGATEPRQQRVVVIGDGDFASNTFVGNGGNKQVALRLLEWAAADEALLAVATDRVRDAQLTLSSRQLALIGFGFLLGIPGFWAVWAATTWRARRRA